LRPSRSGPSRRIGKKIKGSIKEVAGKATGDAKLEAEGKADKIEGKVQNAVGGLKDILKSTASTRGNQPAKNVACQRRNDRRGPFLRPGRSAGGISECKPHFANKTCQAEPLAKAQRR
jgi:uncharacterized protein YjbJ (UPF0337 family)